MASSHSSYPISSSDPAVAHGRFNLVRAFQRWFAAHQIDNPQFAHLVCRMIPAQCPFERDVVFLGRTLFHVPPLCKLNPFYEQLIELRFEALSFLANECGEDVTPYCC